MRLDNSGKFCVGQMPRTSHVATRPKKHVSDASVPRCHGLLPQAPPQVCSWLVVQGILHVIRTRYSYRLLDPTVRLFPPLFGWFFQTITRGLFAAACCCCCCCCLFTISLFFALLSPPECMRQSRMMVFVLDERSGAACYIHK